jgi:hypothetical protein
MLVVFGLNKDIWNQIGAAERAQYTWSAWLYLLSCLLSGAASVRFMQQLSDSYTIGVLGGLLVGYIVSVVTRIALITMVSLPLHPTPSTPPVPERSRRPDFSVVFRLLIIALMSLVVALPVAALLGYNEAENISTQRRSQVMEEFKANHPAMTSEQHRLLMANLRADHFPIHVYRELAHQPIGVISMLITGACFLIPFFMLWHLRRGSQFHYAKLNRAMLVNQIETDYAMTLEQSRAIQQNRFGQTKCVIPNQAWLDAPFNTRSIEETTQRTLEMEAAFLDRLKTI